MTSPEKLYAFHVQNARSIDVALDRIALTLRDSVARADATNIAVFTRLFALLLGAWAECRLAKLTFEPTVFTDDDRSRISKGRTHLDRWRLLVELAIRKHYSRPRAKLSSSSLGHTAFQRYQALISLLDEDLSSVITLRNKLAHGQWEYPLTDDCKSVATSQMKALKKENALSLQLKRNLLDHLIRTVHDLVVSQKAFERDCDCNYSRLEQARTNLATRSYESYRKQLSDRFNRGKSKRASQSNVRSS